MFATTGPIPLEIKGRLKNHVHNNRTTLVDGYLVDNGIVSIAIECGKAPDGVRRGDPVVVEGTLKSIKG